MAEEIVKTDEGLAPDAFDLAFEAAAGVDAVEEAAAEEEVVEKEAAVDEKVEPTAEEKAAEEKAAADKAAAEKAEADRKAVADKVAAEKAEADRKAAAEKAEADRLAQEQFTEEEQAAIDANAKDFPDVHKAYEARERVLVTKLTNKFMAELAAVREEFGKQIAPVANTVATNAFEAAILKAHPDAFDVVDKVDAWAATKPAFMQKQINDILDHGAGGAQATIDVLDLFKAETAGSAQPPGESAEEKAAAEAKAAEEKEAKNKKLQSQEGVRSRSTQKQAAVDPEDFDGAYEKFAATSA